MRRNFAIFISALSLCFIISFLALIFGHKVPLIHKLNSSNFQQAASSSTGENLHLADYDGVSRERQTLRRSQDVTVSPPISVLDIDLNHPELFSSNPPSASDTAVMVTALRQAGAKQIFFSTLFAWDSKDDFDVMLKTALESSEDLPLESSLLPLTLTRSAKDSAPPAFLSSSMLDLSQIEGDTHTLAKINSIVNHPVDGSVFKDEAAIPNTVQFGFSSIESQEFPYGKLPLLARWGNKVLLHHSLLCSMKLHQVNPSELKIILGETISLGENKPLIPIDEFGLSEYNITNSTGDIKTYKAHEIMEREALKDLAPTVLIVSTPDKNHNIQQIGQAHQTLTQLYQSPLKHLYRNFYRWSIWLETLFMILLTALCGHLSTHSTLKRHIFHASALLVLYPLSLLHFHLSAHWFPISPLFLLLLTSWGSSEILSRKFSLRRQNSRAPASQKKELVRFD